MYSEGLSDEFQMGCSPHYRKGEKYGKSKNFVPKLVTEAVRVARLGSPIVAGGLFVPRLVTEVGQCS